MIAILCLVLFGGVQISQMFMAQEVLNHAAACGARARAVGFNDFMVQKTIRVAAIPIAGQLVQPVYTPSAADADAVILNQHHVGGAWYTAVHFHGSSDQTSVEKANMPYYLGAPDWGAAAGYLDYKLDYLNKYGWTYVGDTVTKTPNIEQSVHLQNLVNAILTEDAVSVTATVNHDFPLNYALHRALFAGVDVLPLTGKATVEKHYDLYLQ